MDRIVGDQPADEFGGGGRGERRQPVFCEAANGHAPVADKGEGSCGGEAGRIGDPRPRQHVHDRRQAVERGRQSGRSHQVDDKSLADRVGQEHRGQPFHRAAVEVCLDEPAGGGAGSGAARDPQGGGPGDQIAGGMVGCRVGNAHINFPQHREHPWRGRGG